MYWCSMYVCMSDYHGCTTEAIHLIFTPYVRVLLQLRIVFVYVRAP